MDYETIIRNSNTIFSTMVCPKCKGSVTFKPVGDGIRAICDDINCSTNDIHSDTKIISVDNLCSLLNNNGLNYLVQSTANKSN